MKEKISEKTLERRFREAVKKRGGLALKWRSWDYTKMPDRLTLIPPGLIFWFEFKSDGKAVYGAQKARIEMLQKMGFYAGVINSTKTLKQALDDIDSRIATYNV